MKIIILGTAHLKSTPGKCSPDKKFFEYKYSREIVSDIKSILESYGYKVFVDIPESDLKLTQNQELLKRVNFVNDVCKIHGANNCIYVSIHVNAAFSDGKWHDATGWEAYTTKGKTKSDKLAECLYKSAQKNLTNKKIRKDLADGDSDKESNFYVLRNTKCPAVLTENFFQDTKKDVEFLLSDVGRQQIVRLHVEGIINYIKDN